MLGSLFVFLLVTLVDFAEKLVCFDRLTVSNPHGGILGGCLQFY